MVQKVWERHCEEVREHALLGRQRALTHRRREATEHGLTCILNTSSQSQRRQEATFRKKKTPKKSERKGEESHNQTKKKITKKNSITQK